MNDEDFKQIVIDFINMVTTQRHREIMATLAEVEKKLDDKIAAFAAAAAMHNDEIRKALSILADTGISGHASVLDKISAKIDTISDAETLGTMTGELKTAIATTPLPGQSPGVV
jgi:hypothetical protein